MNSELPQEKDHLLHKVARPPHIFRESASALFLSSAPLVDRNNFSASVGNFIIIAYSKYADAAHLDAILPNRKNQY